MKNTSRKPYIYKVTNLETHRYYIGSQCSGKTIGANYFTSSTNKNFREDFKSHKEKYEITIIKEFEDPEECVRAENYMIRDHMLLKDGLCLNRACRCNGEKVFSAVGIHHAPWNKGMRLPDETRKKMSEAHKGIPRSEETKQKMRKPKKGHPAQNRITISIEGIVFDSLTEASKHYNVTKQAISKWAKKNQHNAFYITK